MIRRRLKNIALALLGAGVLGGGQAMAGPTDSAYVRERPGAAPVRATTNFDATLRCMDDLLARNGYGNGIDLVPISLTDPKGDVGAATRDMIVAAASRMSEKSRFFTIHPTVDPASLHGGVLIARGSITEFDKAVDGKGTGWGIGGTLTGVGMRKQRQSSVITVTLYFTDPTGALVPGTVQSVSMALSQQTEGGDLTGEIGDVGGFYELEFSHADGLHQAVRALIDLAMTEAVGAYAQAPYHRCLAVSGADPAAALQARKVFDHMKPPERITAIAKALAARELLREPPPSAMDAPLREAIADYEAQEGLPPLGLPTFDVYYALYQASYGAVAAPPTALMSPGPGVKVSPYGPGFHAMGDKGYLLSIGDRASFAVTVLRSAHVACYYTDGLKRTTRVFPNAQRTGDRLSAGETLVIPGPLDVYTIEPDVPSSREQLTCIASADELQSRLTPELRTSIGAGVAPIPVSGARDLIARARQAFGPDLSSDTFDYVVCAGASDCVNAAPPAEPPGSRPGD